MEKLLVFTNLPDRAAAQALAAALIEGRLAACVNVLAECTSVYRWHGQVESSAEVPVLIKTRAARYPEVEALIRSLHPYELPEIVALPIVDGAPNYLNWLDENLGENPGTV